MAMAAGCASLAPTPLPPIDREPGDWIVVAPGRVEAAAFRFVYAPSWRVVALSPARAEQRQIVLVAPGGGAITLTQANSADPLADHSVSLEEGVVVNVEIQAPAEASTDFERQTRRLLDSIRL